MNRRQALFGLSMTGLALGGCMRRPEVRPDFRLAGPYVLATGDRLRIIVFGQDSLSNIYQIDASGRIAMPLVGVVQVGGLSTAGAANAIAAKLRGGFIREPKVTVEVDTYRPFFILGEVTNSGQFPFVNGATIQTAVAIAGGFTPRAERNYAELTRRTPRGIVVGDVPITYPIRPGDTIVIKERWF
ncbi:polysaccharide biosynthesis/export family protein [Enterovirga rhinocerotis]|uniref:Polysaccharide export outer membrane protein n=1 Tax=Enterovirga rhinocerotis TaxID=1339210 RepID=A0A4R7CCE1_9HYPH|nr:polysaccharide biosynthesis/export family protein [Enterovirga rhinocerotis]TDR94816.1 polysaccharide export outer membrane protein [Enterovirga rhinocerotis]